MIPADLGAELTRAISAAVAAGDLPAEAERATPAGTWRPIPPSAAPSSAGPASPAPASPSPASAAPASAAVADRAESYATSLPFELARLVGEAPADVAARLAVALRPVGWIRSAAPTGGGYLTITVTAEALAGLAVRITRAGAGCARSTALTGVSRPAPPLPDLAAEPDWPRAWRAQAAALTGRLAEAAGATATPTPTQTSLPELSNPASRPAPPRRGPVADAVSYAGADAVRYALARIPASRARDAEREISVMQDLRVPFYAVSFAHADAASVLRWAGDLGLRRAEPDRRLASLLGLPPEVTLLGQLSWLAERVAGAARRGQPAELPRYLEEVARAWLDCRERCPALPFGGQAAPRDASGISARLWLAAATQAVLAAGLELIGVTARDRL